MEFIEQPLPADDWDGMRRVFAESALPVMADESCRVEEDVARCRGFFHGINIKLGKCGGMTPARRMIDAARRLGLKVMMGCMTESTVGISAIAQFLPLLDYVDMDGAVLIARDVRGAFAWKKAGRYFPRKTATVLCWSPGFNGRGTIYPVRFEEIPNDTSAFYHHRGASGGIPAHRALSAPCRRALVRSGPLHGPRDRHDDALLRAPWLTRESRQREEDCKPLLKALHVKPGQTVCDMGCGNGFYTLKLAEAGRQARARCWPSTSSRKCSACSKNRAEGGKAHEHQADPRHGQSIRSLPEGEVDLILLVDVYHEFSHPEQMLAAMRKSLKPKGRIALVEFRAGRPERADQAAAQDEQGANYEGISRPTASSSSSNSTTSPGST